MSSTLRQSKGGMWGSGTQGAAVPRGLFSALTIPSLGKPSGSPVIHQHITAKPSLLNIRRQFRIITFRASIMINQKKFYNWNKFLMSFCPSAQLVT